MARYSKSQKSTIKQINTAGTWFKEWNISINSLKITLILFTNKAPFYTGKIKVNNKTINWSSKNKYLGMIIDENLCFTDNIVNTIDKTVAAKHSPFPIINSRSTLLLRMKLYIYKTFMRPIVT